MTSLPSQPAPATALSHSKVEYVQAGRSDVSSMSKLTYEVRKARALKDHTISDDATKRKGGGRDEQNLSKDKYIGSPGDDEAQYESYFRSGGDPTRVFKAMDEEGNLIAFQARSLKTPCGVDEDEDLVLRMGPTRWSKLLLTLRANLGQS